MTHSAEDEALDRPGSWSIKVTVYRNGKRVGVCDTEDWGTFDEAAYWAGEGLRTREIDMHVPRKRIIPPAKTEDA